MALTPYSVTLIRVDVDGTEIVIPNTDVRIWERTDPPGQILAQIFSDEAGLSPLPNPSPTDATGTLTIYADAGPYDWEVGGVFRPFDSGVTFSSLATDNGESLIGSPDSVAALSALTIDNGNTISTKGLVSAGDGGGEKFFTQASIGAERVDNLKNVQLAGGNFAVRDKPFFVARAPADSGFAPNEVKYLFMDPIEYEAENSGEAIKVTNQFHFFHPGDDVRCEFEAGVGDMQFYIESGPGQSAWYGWQEGATHHFSFGTDPTDGYSLKLCGGFGVEGVPPNFAIGGPGSAAPGQVLCQANVPARAPLKVVSPAELGALGMLVTAGREDTAYLADYRHNDGTVKATITGRGQILATIDPLAGTRPGFSFVGNENTGINNPGLNAVAVLTGGAERMRVNSLGNLLIGNNFSSGGTGVIEIENSSVAPTNNNATGGTLYVENGALKFRGSSGTVTTIAPA